jgi:hypothetical protein
MQVVAMTGRWIDEGGTFWPLMATVQEGVRGVVGATNSVAMIPVVAGIVTGYGGGLDRNREATRITRRIMLTMMSQGIWDRLD